MPDRQQTADPFARLAELPTDQRLFAVKQPKTENPTPSVTQESTPIPKQKSTSTIAPKPTPVRGPSRDKTRETSREKSYDLPTRNEIQEFTFRLRDELKVKVQAEVPHKWQEELEDLARALDVKKLELYRFILGEFLGKVRRKKAG